MEIRSSRVGDSKSLKTVTSFDKLISLYEIPPNEELTLDEFEIYALDRLQLLRGIENLKTRGFDGAEYAAKLTEVNFIFILLNHTIYLC